MLQARFWSAAERYATSAKNLVGTRSGPAARPPASASCAAPCGSLPTRRLEVRSPFGGTVKNILAVPGALVFREAAVQWVVDVVGLDMCKAGRAGPTGVRCSRCWEPSSLTAYRIEHIVHIARSWGRVGFSGSRCSDILVGDDKSSSNACRRC